MITPTLVEPTENHEAGVASGVWSTQDQLEARRGGVWPEAGVPNPDQFIENNFSTFLYEGNGSTQTITTGIDSANKSSLVWIKNRDATDRHILTDTVRGATKILHSDGNGAPHAPAAEATDADTITAFSSTGFALGDDVQVNTDAESYVAWTFKKAPNFFDIVTYEGTGSARTVAHSLGGTVGMMLIKNRDVGDNWAVYHRANTAAPQTDYLILNTNVATADSADWWNDTAPTTSVFTVGTDHAVNADGESYVAYVFAHETGSDSMIQCGSYTGNGNATGPSIDLGWEPQWLLTKASTRTSDWSIVDSMRGVVTGGVDQRIGAQNNDTETPRATHSVDMIDFNAEGFNVTNSATIVNGNTETYIYVAIRRPNMKTHTDATEVFAVAPRTDTIPGFTSGFPVDFVIGGRTINGGDINQFNTRLISDGILNSQNNNAENTSDQTVNFGHNDGFFNFDGANANQYCWMWKRAKSYFDVVAYTGTGSAKTEAHSLGVAPEMMWIKSRSNAVTWRVYHTGIGETHSLFLDDVTAKSDDDTIFNDTAPTSSVFTVGADNSVNNSGYTYVAFLFATLAGVSKVGSVTHSGSSTDVDCGFSAGARFVFLRRHDDEGDWYFWDSVRGIVSGNDPYLLFNTNAAQVTNTDYIDPLASGFQISGDFTDGDYIFYAIA